MICYASFEEKRRKWPHETAPAILREARRAAESPDTRARLIRWMRENGIRSAESLHNQVARMAYVPTPEPRRHCDPIQRVEHTLQAGGDCDQWAAVVMACLRILNHRWKIFLVATGDARDPYRHAATVFHHTGRWYRLDPHPGPEYPGTPAFDVRTENHPLQEFFGL
jgi:hypothetical protein